MFYPGLRHKRIRYDLKVAMKTRDTYKLKYTINEFKTEKVEDKDMDLIKAEKLLKEIGCRDGRYNTRITDIILT